MSKEFGSRNYGTDKHGHTLTSGALTATGVCLKLLADGRGPPPEVRADKRSSSFRNKSSLSAAKAITSCVDEEPTIHSEEFPLRLDHWIRLASMEPDLSLMRIDGISAQPKQPTREEHRRFHSFDRTSGFVFFVCVSHLIIERYSGLLFEK